MAVGYFSRAVSRASPGAPGGAQARVSARVQPAAPIASPLTEDDQRLNLVDETLRGPGEVPVPDSAAPVPVRSEPGTPLETAGHEASADSRTAPELAETPSETRAHPVPRTGEAERPAPRRPPAPSAIATPPPQPVAPRNGVDDGPAADALPTPARAPNDFLPDAEAVPANAPAPEKPAPASPVTAMLRALSAAERWVAEEPETEPPEVLQTHQPTSPTQGHNRSDITPVLPHSAEPAGQRESAPPQVVIDNIEIEIVAPPAAQPRPAPRNAPVKPLPRPVMPYGWRQR